jgi:hypothetical protein
MIAVMMSTFILFFAFVINTGMLIHAKINIQNAADMAAYAGASVQARQLTQISYLNYEMRRQWKKFLFRIYVLGNLYQDSFPKGPSGSGTTPMQYFQIDLNNNKTSYGAPITCVVLNSDNYCRLSKLPSLYIPADTFLDSINAVLRETLINLNQIRKANCTGIAITNKFLNYYWLYNADPSLSAAKQALGDLQGNITNSLLGLIDGIGIVPRELLLKFRIKTLESYVNDPPASPLNYEKTQALMGSIDPPAHERSIQAFLSAYYTLGNHTFPANSIQMDELQSPNQLKLNYTSLASPFDTYAIDQTFGGAEINGSGDPHPDCQTVLVPVSVKRPLTLGVFKEPSTLTYYAVRVKAKAKILFSPFGDLDLKAYAAARPFGSRIGPTHATFVRAGTPNTLGFANTNVAGFIPNLPVRKQDSASTGNGWDTMEVLGEMYSAISPSTAAPNGLGAGGITSSMIHQAYAKAMAPNPWESRQYNIINDAGQDAFIQNFGNNEIAAIWAPIFTPENQANSSKEIQTEVQALFTDPQSLVGIDGLNPYQGLQDSVTQSLQTYIATTLSQPRGGENYESQWVATITNPFKLVTNDGTPPQDIVGDPNLILTSGNPLEFKTSWNKPRRSDLQAQGRVGYSIKFVSFDSIAQHQTSSNGQDLPNNDIGGDAEASLDIPFIKH